MSQTYDIVLNTANLYCYIYMKKAVNHHFND